MNQVNRMGQVYTLSAEFDYDNSPTGRTMIRTGHKSIMVEVPIDRIANGWKKWMHDGLMIQSAFPFLSPDEREFIMTGITESEWNELFKGDEK